MKITTHTGSMFPLNRPQQVWIGDNLMQTARFAGQDMMAVTDDAGRFRLDYLGHLAEGFPSMESAKSAAPAFAKQVLERMITLIRE